MTRPAAPRSARAVVGTVVTAVLAALVLSGCSRFGFDGLDDTGDKGFIEGSGQVLEIAEADRTSPVTMAGDDLRGDPVDVTDLRGRPVVVNIWGSWCAPCAAEAPLLATVSEEWGDAVGFVGLNERDTSAANGLAFERRYGITYPSIYDRDGSVMLDAFRGKVSLVPLPITVVLDAEGRVASVISGPIPSETTLRELVESAGADLPPAPGEPGYESSPEPSGSPSPTTGGTPGGVPTASPGGASTGPSDG